MENKYCTKCGSDMVYRKGEKNGKPWAGHFCSMKCGSKPEWVNLKQATAQRTQTPSHASLNVIGETLTDIKKKLDKLELMVIKIGKMMKSQLPPAPENAHIPVGEPPIPIVEEGFGEKPDYDF